MVLNVGKRKGISRPKIILKDGRAAVMEEMPDLTFISEPNAVDMNLAFVPEGYTSIQTNSDLGVAIMVKDSTFPTLVKFPTPDFDDLADVKGRVVLTILDVQLNRTLVCGYHGAHNHTSDKTRGLMLENVIKMLSKVADEKECSGILMGGDFNYTVSDWGSHLKGDKKFDIIAQGKSIPHEKTGNLSHFDYLLGWGTCGTEKAKWGKIRFLEKIGDRVLMKKGSLDHIPFVITKVEDPDDLDGIDIPGLVEITENLSLVETPVKGSEAKWTRSDDSFISMSRERDEPFKLVQIMPVVNTDKSIMGKGNIDRGTLPPITKCP
jgi:hypothetical protein